MALELFLPFPLDTVSQKFGENANASYSQDGLKGHTAYDFAPENCWGMPIHACVDGPVYSVMHKGDPDPSQYRAVFQLVQDDKHPDLFYEVSYGHMNDIYVQPGDSVKAGDVIGTIGNTGPVYSRGVAVTKEARLAGSHDGAHLHGPQVRACRRVTVTAPNSHLLSDGFGVYRDVQGCYYEVLDYENGFNGCSDPSLYFNGVLAQNAPKLRSKMAQLISLLQRFAAMLKAAPPAPTQIS